MRTNVHNLSEAALVALYATTSQVLTGGDRSVKSLRDEIEDEIWRRGLPTRDWLESLDRSGARSDD